MKRKEKIYRVCLAWLLFFLSLAGLAEVHAQTTPPPVTPQDTIVKRQPPKARARRLRMEPKQQTDSIRKNVPAEVKMTPVDSLQIARIQTTDSIGKANAANLKQLESPVTISTDSLSSTPPAKPKVFMPNPNKATWFAVIFPGGGQIYNRKYWKLPIIYGGFAGCAYALTWNSKMYKDYSNAYMDIMDNNPNTNSFQDLLPPNYNYPEDQLKETLRKRKDMFRRYRDLSIFAFIGVYLISIVDAYVDAELSNFDISPDLSMKVEPAVINDQFNSKQKSVGLQCVFRF